MTSRAGQVRDSQTRVQPMRAAVLLALHVIEAFLRAEFWTVSRK